MGMATSMGIVTAHIAREALTPAELNMIGEINQMTPFDIRIEDQPLTLARATELQRQYSARGNGRLVRAACARCPAPASWAQCARRGSPAHCSVVHALRRRRWRT